MMTRDGDMDHVTGASMTRELWKSSMRALRISVARLLVISVSILLLATIQTPAQAEPDETYQLGPGDRLSVRVVRWDNQELDFVEWDAVSGSFSISSNDTLSIPLAGTFSTLDKDLDELSLEVSAKLNESVQLIETPSVVIEIETYRPFYVIGDVERPGAFEATPGLGVMQAYALAGGAPYLREAESNDLRGVMRDAGDLSRIRREEVRLQVLAHRLNAELRGADTFEIDVELRHPDGSEALDRLISDETEIFATRKEARALERQSLEELKILLATEISQLETKRLRLADQILTAREVSDNLAELGDRGLARADQLRDAQRAIFELESQDIDLENGIFRAQQGIKEAERDIVSIQTQLLTQVTAELQRVNAELEDRAQRSKLLISMLDLFSVGVPQSERQFSTEFFITRSTTDGAEVQVTGDTPIGPGDILRVQRRAADSTSN